MKKRLKSVLAAFTFRRALTMSRTIKLKIVLATIICACAMLLLTPNPLLAQCGTCLPLDDCINTCLDLGCFTGFCAGCSGGDNRICQCHDCPEVGHGDITPRKRSPR